MAIADTRARILDATLELLAEQGLARLSLEDVAHLAEVSRQTVYRHFGNRDLLFSAVILREEDVFIARIVAATQGIEDLEETLAVSIREVLAAAREHPLLDRLLATEPEVLLPFMTSALGPVLPAARPVLAQILRERLPGLEDPVIEGFADLCTRLMLSYTVNPPEVPIDLLATLLARLIVRGVEGLEGAPLA